MVITHDRGIADMAGRRLMRDGRIERDTVQEVANA